MIKKLRKSSSLFVFAIIVCIIWWAFVVFADNVSYAQNLKSPDPFTLVSDKNLLTDYKPVDDNGDINVVVEIPTGTTAKWEVVKPSGELNWKFLNGKPRRVKYLGYPGNYGMVPRTIMPKELGGDGDPIDVLVLGPPVARGSVVQAKLIGVLKMIDKGEQDDKLIAVLRDTPFYTSPSIKELDETFLGVTDIIQIWFTNYKGPDKIETEGFGDEIEARRILQSAINAFNQSQENRLSIQ